MNRTFVLMALLLICWLASCQESKETAFRSAVEALYSGTVPLIRPDSVTVGSKLIFLDSRSEEEYEVSHLPGAYRVGYEDFDAGRLPEDIGPEDTLLVYCSVGYRSERIGEKLRELGYSNVYNLYGGIFWWMYKDKEVVNSEDRPTLRVHGYDDTWSKLVLKGEEVH